MRGAPGRGVEAAARRSGRGGAPRAGRRSGDGEPGRGGGGAGRSAPGRDMEAAARRSGGGGVSAGVCGVSECACVCRSAT